MGRLSAPIAAVAALVLGGCGAADPSLPPACTDGPGAVVRALRAAPGAVTLAGGTPLSACVADVRSDADLQGVGLVLTGAAERLASRAARDPDAALQLGYLVGAARRGVAPSEGITAELVRRLEGSARRAGTSPALVRGLHAGERTG